jgi:hypothetical protein
VDLFEPFRTGAIGALGADRAPAGWEPIYVRTADGTGWEPLLTTTDTGYEPFHSRLGWNDLAPWSDSMTWSD